METKQLSEASLLSILDIQPEPILVYAPVFAKDQTGITDFEIIYINKEAVRQSGGLSASELLGERVRTMRSTNETLRELFFQELSAVYTTGIAAENRYHNPLIDMHFHVTRMKIADGVLTIARNVTQQIKLQQERERQINLTNKILDISLNGWFVCEAVWENEVVVDFVITRINEGFTQLSGLTKENVIGKRYLTLFPAARLQGVFDLNQRVFTSGKKEHHQIHYKGDGLDAWYDVVVGKLDERSLIVTFSDITEQQEAATVIQQKNALLDNLLSHSANGISVSKIIRNADGVVVDSRTILANDAAVAFTGIPKDVLLSKSSVQIEPNILETPLYKMSVQTLLTGEPSFLQYKLESTGKWLEISVSRMDNDHLITIFTDITQSKEAQLQQEQTLNELQRSNNALEEFARAASHDLKEPIRKVHVFTDRLKSSIQNRITESELHMVERIEAATKRMMLLIDDLLTYADIDKGNLQQAAEDVNLTDKVGIVLSDLEVLIQEKGAVVYVESLPTVKGYRRQLQQLFQNLISNALKYSKPDVAPVIQITCQVIKGNEADMPLPPAVREKTFYLVEVKDNGIGFAQEDAEKIFGVFTRLHGKGEYAGTGIGLSIVKKVAENHRGFVWATSKKGVGSTFSVLLPHAG